ncbi:MAG TPA: hypothetical protein VHW65_12170 [Gemmatimonadales bacterium]|nr:hypothetical protein [Gemmatimonadales bacterium]
MRFSHALTALLGTCAIAVSLSAQRLAAPADSTLAGITARGRMLVQYDIAEWHAGDALAALKPQPDEIARAIVRTGADGRHEVLYGKLNGAKDSFVVRYHAVQTDNDSGYRAERLVTPLVLTGTERLMAVALVAATARFGRISRPYNSYVMPATPSGYWVYFLPAQTDARSFPHGGDVRYRYDADGRDFMDSVRFHQSVLNLPSVPGAVASTHTTLATVPSETDVFMVLRRAPHLPEIVVTKGGIYQIHLDGTIGWRNTDPLALPLATAPTPPALWKAVIDTVGSAVRIMSPGYTRWRDTSTGWRMSLERTVTLPDAQPNSFQQSRRTQLLPNGSVLVSQRDPTAITLYDSTGRLVRTIGQVGTGLEDFHGDITMAVYHDTVVVNDALQGRALLFTLDGNFLRSFATDIRTSAQIAVDSRGYLRIPKQFGFPPATMTQWMYFDLAGQRIDSIVAPPARAAQFWRAVVGTTNIMFAVPMAPHTVNQFLLDGTLVTGATDAYQFLAMRNAHDTVRLFGRTNVAPVAMDPAAGDSLFASIIRNAPPGLAAGAHREDLPGTYSLWDDMAVDDRGYLWVVSHNPPAHTYSVDIFSATGYYLGRLNSWFDNFNGASWSGDRVAAMGYDAERRPVVRIYRLDRRGM